jgi:hypothetical protein
MNTESNTPKIPNAIKNLLLADEKVMAVVKQSRFKSLITPDSIIITNQRIIRYSPSNLGLHKEIEDYRYEDIANLKINKGIVFATINIKKRFMSEDLVIDKLSNNQADIIYRVVQENLQRRNSPSSSQMKTDQQIPPPSSADPLQALKLRFAKGEITKEQYEETKKILE